MPEEVPVKKRIGAASVRSSLSQGKGLFINYVMPFLSFSGPLLRRKERKLKIYLACYLVDIKVQYLYDTFIVDILNLYIIFILLSYVTQLAGIGMFNEPLDNHLACGINVLCKFGQAWSRSLNM